MVVSPNKRISIAQAWQHPWLSSNSRFSEFDDEPSSDLKEEMENLSLSSEVASQVTSSPAAVSEGLGLPEVMLELLPNHHLSTSLVECAMMDEDGISYIQITIDPNKPSVSAPPDPSQEAKPPVATGLSTVTLFLLPKAAREDQRSDTGAPNSPKVYFHTTLLPTSTKNPKL